MDGEVSSCLYVGVLEVSISISVAIIVVMACRAVFVSLVYTLLFFL